MWWGLALNEQTRRRPGFCRAEGALQQCGVPAMPPCRLQAACAQAQVPAKPKPPHPLQSRTVAGDAGGHAPCGRLGPVVQGGAQGVVPRVAAPLLGQEQAQAGMGGEACTSGPAAGASTSHPWPTTQLLHHAEPQMVGCKAVQHAPTSSSLASLSSEYTGSYLLPPTGGPKCCAGQVGTQGVQSRDVGYSQGAVRCLTLHTV